MPGGVRKVLQDWLRHVDGLKEVRPQTDEEDDEVHDGFEEEFLRLKDESSRFGNEGAYASLAGKLECNRRKNRYKDILPYDLSRVKLRELEGVAGSDYINASFVKGASGTQEYIAAQAPLPHTLNDFWRMIIEQEVVIIVMAANEREGNKVKCERYWPEVKEEKTFGDISVSLLNEEWHNDYFVERLMCAKWQPSAHGQHAGSGRRTPQQLLQQEPFERRIVQYHYVAWPDHGIPSPNASIPDFVERVRCRQRELLGADVDGTPAPVLVHCSAGCGRTGTVIAIDYVQQLLDTHKWKGNPELLADFSLFNIALDLRKQRSAMIQTKDQYVVVYNAVAELVRDALSELGGRAGSRGIKAVTHPSPKPGPSFATSSGAAARKTQEPEAGLNEMEDLIANLSQPLPACGTGRLQPGQQPVQPTSPKGRTAVAAAAAAASADAPASLPSPASREPPALQQQQASSAGGGESCNATGNSPAWPPATAPKSSSEAGQRSPAAAAPAVAAFVAAAAGRAAERSVAAYENVQPMSMRPPRSKSLRLHSLVGGGQATDTLPTPRSVQQQPTTQQLDSEAAAASPAQDRAAALATAAAAAAAVSAKSKPLSPPTPSHGLVADAAGGSTSWYHVTSVISPGSPSSKRQQQPGTAVGMCTSPAQGLGTGGSSSSGSAVVTWHKAYDVSTAAPAASAAVSSKAWPSLSVWPAVGGSSSVKLLRAHPQQQLFPLTRHISDPAAAASGVQHSLLAQPCQSEPAQLLQQQPSIAASPTSAAANQRANHPVTSLDSLTSTSAEASAAASSAPKTLPNPQAAAAQPKASASIGAVATSSGNVGGEAVASNSLLSGASPDSSSTASSVYAELQPRHHAPGCRPLPALPGANDGGPLEPSSASPSSTPRTRQSASSEYVYVDLYSVNKWSLQHIARGCPAAEGAVSEASSYSTVGDDSEEDVPTPVVPPKTIDAHFTYDARELQLDSLESESGEAGSAHCSGSSPSPGPPPKTRQLASVVAADMANLPNKMKGLFQPSKKPSVLEPPAASRANSSVKEDVVYHGVNISYPNVVGKPKGQKGMPLQWKQPSGDSLPFPRST